jgi:hypothetical protein
LYPDNFNILFNCLSARLSVLTSSLGTPTSFTVPLLAKLVLIFSTSSAGKFFSIAASKLSKLFKSFAPSNPNALAI